MLSKTARLVRREETVILRGRKVRGVLKEKGEMRIVQVESERSGVQKYPKAGLFHLLVRFKGESKKLICQSLQKSLERQLEKLNMCKKCKIEIC